MPNSDLTFNTTPGQTVGREMLIAYLNTGENETPKWSPIGKRVEDSSSEYDWQTETKVDIFGNTYTNGKKPTITQSFDPCELDADDAEDLEFGYQRSECQCFDEPRYADSSSVCRNSQHGGVCGAVFFLFHSS